MGSVDTRKKIQVRLTEEEIIQLKYWSKKDDISINEWIEDAIRQSIAIKNGDFQLPSIALQRLNQMVDNQAAILSAIDNNTKIVLSGFSSLTTVMKGDNYLMEEEDGEL